MRKPTFSVCIPNYNYGSYLKQTIESVLKQTYPVKEIIISDNASTDNSIEVIKSINSDKIKLIQNVFNIGYSGNVDKATSVASGEYMILLLADDMLKEDALEEFARLIELYSNGEDVVICGQVEDLCDGKVGKTRGPTGGRIREILKMQGKTNIVSEEPSVEIYSGVDIFRILMTTNFTTPGPVQATCFSKSLFEKVEGFSSPTVTIPDASFGHKICLLTPRIIYYRKPLAYFRIHETSFTADINKIKNIKLLTDKYILSHEFTDSQLESVGLSRKHLQIAFIKYWCIRNPFYYLYSGRIAKFYFYFIFGFASYPRIMLSQPKTYIVFAILWLAPMFWILGNVYRRLLKKYLVN